ncbi:hypothetical protein B0T20DRAFT_352254 [Sordaria brevicollis]|uniref:Myb-like domain-containing protein n=1 Tax=Sordaria brevicollis TaxID=83679 RepID=A0AAE0PFT8_SORBR|nr:hypothetical protein B0T20DRAFT_352254 [Sordaria brevicollis]
MFINKSKPSQEEANDEMVWQNNLLATDPSTTSTLNTSGFAPSPHNAFVDQDWNKSLPEGYRQTGQTNDPTPSSLPLHNNNLYQFDPSCTSHLGVGMMGMSMNMMTSSFNTSFDSSNMSSPSAGATWSEASPEYEETRRQHEAQPQDNMSNNGSSTNGTTSSASGSFHRPSTTESSNTSNATGNGGNGAGNDAQSMSFSPATDATWDSSHSPAPMQDNYMDMADNIGTNNNGANMTSPNGDGGNDNNMPAYPGQGRQQQRGQHQQQQQQPTGFGQHFSEAAASLQGSTESDGFYNNNVADTFSSPHQPHMSDLPFWSSGPSPQQAITFSSPSFVPPNQGEPRWLEEMSDGGSMPGSGMPSSPITLPFHNGGMTGHHGLPFDGLPSPTPSAGSLSFGRSSGNNIGGGSVSLPHQNQNHQQQFPSVGGMFNDGGQLASSDNDDPFVTTAPGNFSLLSSSPPAPFHNTPSSGDGEILFRGPISHRTVFDDPPLPSSSDPQGQAAHHGFGGGDFGSSPILRSEGLHHNSISPSSLWMNNNNGNNNHRQQHHPSLNPHSSPYSSPVVASGFYHQTQQMAPLPLDFGVPLHPHYTQLQQQGRAPSHRRSLPHTPPRRGGLGMSMSMGHSSGGGPGGHHPHPMSSPLAYNPLTGMDPRGNNPSFGRHHGHHGQGRPHALSHGHQMIRPNAIIPSQHPNNVFSTPQRRQQQPFHGSHPYHHPSLGSSGPGSSSSKRRNVENHGRSSDSAANDAIKRHRAKQDDLLVRLRNQGKSYKQIRQIGKFTEAESTLRGRYRTLTKSREQRVRRPEWTEKDLRLLEQAVRSLAKGPLAVTYSNPKTSSSSSTSPGGDMSVSSLVSPNNKSSNSKASSNNHSRNTSTASSSEYQPRGIPTTTTKVPWKQVAQYIINHGGSYKFGNATVRKRWEQYMREQLARGKDLQQPFWQQRSKKSPYNTHQQSSTSAAHSGRIALASRGQGRHGGGGYGGGYGGVSSRRQSAAGVKAERDQDDEPPYDDWLDMDRLGEHDHHGDGDEDDYDISDAEDDEDDDDDEDDYDEDEGSDQEYKGY